MERSFSRSGCSFQVPTAAKVRVTQSIGCAPYQLEITGCGIKGVYTMEQDKRPVQRVEQLIHVIRGQRVILSTDLAELYDVQPKV